MVKTIDWPKQEGKYYLRIMYQTWFVQADDFDQLFAWIIFKYRTHKYWDYDTFHVFTNAPKDLSKIKTIDWRNMLTRAQKKELKKWQDFNYAMKQ